MRLVAVGPAGGTTPPAGYAPRPSGVTQSHESHSQ